MNSKLDIEAVLRASSNEKKKNIMRANTVSINDDEDSEEAPEDDFGDLPDAIEKKHVKLTKKQRVFEAELIAGMLKHWDEIFKAAVQKKGRKIILSKDEYSINYDVKNRRELILPPEYYLNLTDLEKFYIHNYKDKNPDWDITPLRMYLARRYDIKSDLIHLSNISKFCQVDMVDLIRKRYKPYQNKLLMKVKKRIKLRHARKKIEVHKPQRMAQRNSINVAGAKVKSHQLKKFIIKEAPAAEEAKSPKENDEEKISELSDHDSSRISILDLIILINKKVEDLPLSFSKFTKQNKQGKGFMNKFAFNSFMGVELGLKLTSANKLGLFTSIDWNGDGYATVKEFLKVFSTTEEDIQNAIKDPLNYKEGLILDFVIEQIYHDIIMFKTESIKQIEEKLDAEGRIDINKLETYLGFYKCKITPIEKDLLRGTGVENPKNGKIMVPFLKLIENTRTKTNIRINFRVPIQRKGTSISKSEDRAKRKEEMENYYEEQQRIKQEKEEEERKRIALIRAQENEYSQYEDSDGTPMPQKYLSAATKKNIKNVKNKFGKKFLDMFQKTLFDTIKSAGGHPEELPQFKHYRSTFSSAHPMAHSNGEIPSMMMHNYMNADGAYPINKQGSNPNFGIGSSGFQTLQNNLDYIRSDSQTGTRRNLNRAGIPQKYWPNGRPRGSLERHTGNNLRGKYTRIQQSLYSGIQGTSIRRSNRMSTSNNYQKSLLKSAEKPGEKTFTKEDILFAVEKLSTLYGTPFTVQGHKEKLVNEITKNPELKRTLFTSTTERRTEKPYFSVPASVIKTRPTVVDPPLKIEPISATMQSVKQIRKPFQLNIGESYNGKKYLVPFNTSKEAEKEKIVNLFHKLFKEFNFNKKEDKDLILRHIRYELYLISFRKIYPSALYLSGKKIDNLLKAFMTNTYSLFQI